MENEQDKQPSPESVEPETVTPTDDEKGAGVRIPPPLVLLSFLGLAALIDFIIPLDLPDIALISYAGGVLLVIGIVTIASLGLKFKREETSIEPWKPTHKILSTGLYAYSRNPIYVGFCVIAVSLGLLFGSVWILFSFIPIAFTIYKTAIVKEEQYLESKFGDEYRQYKTRVNRWL